MSSLQGHPSVKGFFENRTSSVQYAVFDPDTGTRRCAIIDPVLDFDEMSGSTATPSTDELLGFVRQEGCALSGRRYTRALAKLLTSSGLPRFHQGVHWALHAGGTQAGMGKHVGRQKAENIHLKEARDKAAFVARRKARDKKLPMAKLILQSLQVNMPGGRLPAPEPNGRRYLKIPLNSLGGAAWGDASEEA